MEVNFYEMYLEEMALIPVLEAEEEKQVLILAAAGDKDAKKRLVEGSLAKVLIGSFCLVIMSFRGMIVFIVCVCDGTIITGSQHE